MNWPADSKIQTLSLLPGFAQGVYRSSSHSASGRESPSAQPDEEAEPGTPPNQPISTRYIEPTARTWHVDASLLNQLTKALHGAYMSASETRQTMQDFETACHTLCEFLATSPEHRHFPWKVKVTEDKGNLKDFTEVVDAMGIRRYVISVFSQYLAYCIKRQPSARDADNKFGKVVSALVKDRMYEVRDLSNDTWYFLESLLTKLGYLYLLCAACERSGSSSDNGSPSDAGGPGATGKKKWSCTEKSLCNDIVEDPSLSSYEELEDCDSEKVLRETTDPILEEERENVYKLILERLSRDNVLNLEGMMGSVFGEKYVKDLEIKKMRCDAAPWEECVTETHTQARLRQAIGYARAFMRTCIVNTKKQNFTIIPNKDMIHLQVAGAGEKIQREYTYTSKYDAAEVRFSFAEALHSTFQGQRVFSMEELLECLDVSGADKEKVIECLEECEEESKAQEDATPFRVQFVEYVTGSAALGSAKINITVTNDVQTYAGNEARSVDIIAQTCTRQLKIRADIFDRDDIASILYSTVTGKAIESKRATRQRLR